MKNTEFTVFDTETTGLSPQYDRVIELAAVRVRGEEKIGEFSTLIQPDRPVPEGASRINGITDAMLADAPRMGEVIPSFSEFIKGSCLCTYNAPFDMGFIINEYRLCGAEFPESDVLDVLVMARALLKLERHPLWFVAQSLGLGADQEHRALSDVELTLGVFRALRGMLAERDVLSLDEYLSLFGRGCGRYDELQRGKVLLIRQAIDSGLKLRLRYFSRSESRVSEREVIPRGIRTERGQAYLTGFCCVKNSERTFNLEGILRLDIPGAPGITEAGRMEGL